MRGGKKGRLEGGYWRSAGHAVSAGVGAFTGAIDLVDPRKSARPVARIVLTAPLAIHDPALLKLRVALAIVVVVVDAANQRVVIVAFVAFLVEVGPRVRPDTAALI